MNRVTVDDKRFAKGSGNLWDMDPTDPTFASGEYREDEDDPFAVIVVEAPLPQTATAWITTHVG